MRIEYKEKFYNAEYPDGYTYVGIYIYLYGCNDVVVDYLYLNYLDKGKRHGETYTKNLYEELVVHKKELSKLTSNEKLRVLAGTRFGRRDLQRFAIPKNNFHFAGIDYDNNERLVPDWYINYDGPVSDYRSGNIMYSEYSNKPLDHEERLKRYHGILQQKKTITQMTAETLQRGVRRLFNLSGGPVTKPLPEVVAVLADPPPLPEIEEDYSSSVTDALLGPTAKPTKLTALDRLDALAAGTLTKSLDLALPYKSRKGKSATASIETEERKLLHLLDALMMEDEPKVKPSRASSPKVETPRATSPKAEAAKVEAPKAEALTEIEPSKEASKAKSLSIDRSRESSPFTTPIASAASTPFDTPITSPEVKMPLSHTELKKEILSKEATLPAYTEEDAVRGKQQAVKETIDEAAMTKIEAELNTIIANLPKNVKAEIKNMYEEFDAPPTYSKSQSVETHKRMIDTYEGLSKLRLLSADEMKKMAGTQYGMEGLLSVTKQRLTDLTEGLVRSGVSAESAKKVNNNIIKALLAAGESYADKYGDSISKSKPKASKSGPAAKMQYESYGELLLK